jgi:dienelactone hydrolase
MQRRSLLILPGAAVLGVPAFAAAIDDIAWEDRAHARSLPLRMRWPGGDAPCGLVVYSHGLGGSREGGDAWGQAWAGAGMAVLHVQHPGSDAEVLRHGMRALRAAASEEQLVARVGDMRFVFDELTRRAQRGEAPWSRVRLDAIGAAGHSFGAVTVQTLAGQRFGDPRFRAFAAFSPSPGQGVVKDDLALTTRPFLALTGSHDSDALGRGLGGADRAAVFDALPRGQRALLWLDRADHMTFGGNAHQPLRARWGLLKRDEAAVQREPRHHALIAALTAQWWRAHLLGDGAAMQALQSPPGLAAEDRWRRD